MKSPFPGMDPFIEGCGLWGDFHALLITKIHDSLAETAPERYVVRTGERSYLVLIESTELKHHGFLPDVGIKASKGRRKKSGNGGVLVAEPNQTIEPVTMCPFIQEEHKEAFVEIYEAEGEQRLVTSIEVLSPSNKRPNSPGWKLYQRKRQSLLTGDVSLIEIDLLRGGQRMPMLDPWPEFLYTLLVARAETFRSCKVWPAHSLRPLPLIPVPLLKPDPDLSLDLQPMIATIYQRSRYARSIDYSRTLDPPLKKDEIAWLKKQARK
ncbi:MAG: DUF4058 family protein [Planctomycetes bacterium]|nr:DUF4058 family protein [Planctomycetota bacterium]